MSHDTLLAEALLLPVADRIQLVQDLWDSIAEVPESVQLSEEHKAILRERLEAHRRDPSAASPWEEVRARLDSKYCRQNNLGRPATTPLRPPNP